MLKCGGGFNPDQDSFFLHLNFFWKRRGISFCSDFSSFMQIKISRNLYSGCLVTFSVTYGLIRASVSTAKLPLLGAASVFATCSFALICSADFGFALLTTFFTEIRKQRVSRLTTTLTIPTTTRWLMSS